jgi:uncharacterized protein YndB with AHSA1/START domain
MSADHSKGYTLTRTFDAPRQLVWDAMTQAEHFAVWFGTSDIEVVDMKMDARTGGFWSGTMKLPDGNTIDWRGKFLDVTPIEKIVQAFSDEGSFDIEAGPDEVELLTTTLTELPDGKTEMVFRQSGGFLTEEQYAEAKEGSSGFLDSLETLLADLKAAA